MFIQAGISCEWTNDSQRFLLEHIDTIRDSPSQIYFSALPFCPFSSWLRGCYSAELSRGVRVVKGVPAEWGACSRTVVLDQFPVALAYWKDTIAVGCHSGEIITFDAITSNRVAVLSEHTDVARSLTFSSDGTFLISGSTDQTLKLWDAQTGGVIKTFCGHTDDVLSVSISPDCTTIASGSYDSTMRLWDVRTGECYRVIDQQGDVYCIFFSPTDPRHLLSASGDVVRQWDTDNHQIGRIYDGSDVAFSSDGTRFVSRTRTTITVRATDSGAIQSKFRVAGDNFKGCCLSPDNRLVAVSRDGTNYIWDITSPVPRLVETFVINSDLVTSTFSSSSLISVSTDGLIRFWPIGASSTDQVVTNPESTSPIPAPIISISLQTRDGIVVSVNSAGVVRTWDVLTGLSKASFQTPAEAVGWGNARLIGDRLIIAWGGDADVKFGDEDNSRIYLWDAEKGGRPRTVGVSKRYPAGLTVSGDGSRIFLANKGSIQAWSAQTGETAGEVRLRQNSVCLDPLRMDGSKVSVRFLDMSNLGWDFGVPGSHPIPLPSTSLERPRLDFIDGDDTEDGGWARVEDTVTGEEVFRLSGRYVQPSDAQWDGRYLAACYGTAEILILDFVHVLPHLR